jgi:hypothetical protein
VIISHAKRFVILAPWKTASSTMHSRLGAYSEGPYEFFYYFNPVLKRVVHQHITYADFAALPESQLGYLTAAFVRNPYDRVYSGFRQTQKDLREQPEAEFRDPVVRRLVMAQLAENFTHLCRAGFAFDRWVELLEDHLVLDVGRNSSFPLHPAHYWTHHNGQQAVDFIGRVENFEADFARLCERLGIEVEDRVNANLSAPADELEGDRRGYRYIDRMNAGSRRRINELFAEDFELFGYERVD